VRRRIVVFLERKEDNKTRFFEITNISQVEYPIGTIVFVGYVGQYHKIF
jgi:hypothetical protein